GVIGLDIAGPESRYPVFNPEFYSYYKFANTFGLKTTIHVGEEYYEGVDNAMSEVIEKYKVKRIGHGIQIAKFPKLMDIASKNNIVFEICISSNLMTKVVKDIYEYAKILKKFEEKGLKYVICTDAAYPLQTNVVMENKKHEKIKNIAKNLKS
ncbi:MAG: hypothetical protein LBC92_04135, partial [Rickettsiales bacterium]|nr:hypothetical protein [Rickettsiales bacterium]